jgi:hypothetical protein
MLQVMNGSRPILRRVKGSPRRFAPDDIIVFLGPTLDRETAERILPARYLPPVACGDILRCLRLKPKVIAIVDGVFEHRASVWHKEILFALERGIAVFGASSMGALRAAEMARFGMIGVGRIFELYRDGVLTDDDEVAVLHESGVGGHRVLSEPMVNIRATVAQAISESAMARQSGDLLVACAKEIFYQERSLQSAVERARSKGGNREELDRFLKFVGNGGYVDQKKSDALELITTLARLDRAPARGRRLRRSQSRTALLQTLVTEVMCAPLERAHERLPKDEQIAVKARSLGPIYRLLCGLAQLLSLSDAVARARKAVPSAETVKRVFEEDDFGLGPQAKDPAWAESHDMAESEFSGYVQRIARIHALLDEEARQNGARLGWRKYLLALLRIHGEYERRTARGSRRDSEVLRALEREDRENFRLFRRMARLWEVVDRAARARGIAADQLPDELQDFADDFREERGLESRRATFAWLGRNGLDVAGFNELIAVWVRLHILINNAQSDMLGVSEVAEDVCWFHDSLRLTGFYTRLKHMESPQSKAPTAQNETRDVSMPRAGRAQERQSSQKSKTGKKKKDRGYRFA